MDIVEIIITLVIIGISIWISFRMFKNFHKPMREDLFNGLEENYKKKLLKEI